MRVAPATAELARSAGERCCRTGPSGVLIKPNNPRIENTSSPSPSMPITATAATAAIARPPCLSLGVGVLMAVSLAGLAGARAALLQFPRSNVSPLEELVQKGQRVLSVLLGHNAKAV